MKGRGIVTKIDNMKTNNMKITKKSKKKTTTKLATSASRLINDGRFARDITTHITIEVSNKIGKCVDDDLRDKIMSGIDVESIVNSVLVEWCSVIDETRRETEIRKWEEMMRDWYTDDDPSGKLYDAYGI